MHFRIKLGDRQNILSPFLFSWFQKVDDSTLDLFWFCLFLWRHLIILHIGLLSCWWIMCISSFAFSCILFIFFIICSQERNHIPCFLSSFQFINNFILIAFVFNHKERCCIWGCLQTIGQSKPITTSSCGVLKRFLENALWIFNISHWIFRCILSKELLGIVCLIEDVVIISWLIKEFFKSAMHLLIILRKSDIEIGNPCKLSIDISFLRYPRPIRHSRTLYRVHVIWIEHLLWPHSYCLFNLRRLIKELLKWYQKLNALPYRKYDLIHWKEMEKCDVDYPNFFQLL